MANRALVVYYAVRQSVWRFVFDLVVDQIACIHSFNPNISIFQNLASHNRNDLWCARIDEGFFICLYFIISLFHCLFVLQKYIMKI